MAVLAKNSADALILHLACARAGAIYVPLNWRLAGDEIAALLLDASPALLFRDAEFAVSFDGPTHGLAGLSHLIDGSAGAAVPPVEPAAKSAVF